MHADAGSLPWVKHRARFKRDCGVPPQHLPLPDGNVRARRPNEVSDLSSCCVSIWRRSPITNECLRVSNIRTSAMQ
jgi:hypothetical protein